MNYALPRLDERLVTDMWPLPCVDPHVSVQELYVLYCYVLTDDLYWWKFESIDHSYALDTV